MPDTVLPTRLVQTVGIATSGILTGYVASASTQLVPRLLEAPTPLLLKQWNNAYIAGKKTAPPFAALSSACYFYLAYTLPSTATKSKLYGYIVAGTLCLGIVPYTLAFMLGCNKKLIAKAEETKTLSVKDEVIEIGLAGETAHQLVDRWGMLNLGRAVLLGAGSLLATWTALDH